MVALEGIDVSHHQGTVDWHQVRSAGVTFAFVKATEGIGFIDPQFKRNWTGAQAAGVTRGAYHFFRPDRPGDIQAKHLLSVVGDDLGELGPVVDLEQGAPDVVEIQAWLDAVEAAAGRPPIVYVSPSFAAAHLKGAFGRYPLWVANYGVPSPKAVLGWDSWTYWQYTDHATCPGVSGHVDGNTKSSGVAATKPSLPSASTTAGSHDSPATYTVVAGDTLNRIAARFHTTVPSLVSLNGLKNPDLIRIGQQLRLP